MAQYDGSIRINTQIDTKGASAQLMTLENRIAKTADKVTSLRSKMDSLKNVKIPTQEYKEIQNQIEDTEKKLTALSERQEKYLSTGGKESSSVYKKMNYDAERLNKTLEYAKSELQDLVDTGKAFTLGSDTEEYSKIGRQLQYAENDLSALYQRYSEMEAKNGSTETSFKGLGDSIRNAFGLAKRGLKDIPIAATKKGIEGLKVAFRGLGSIAKKSLSFMGSKLKNMTTSMFGLGKSAKKSSGLLSTLGSRFKGLALSLLIFNQISKAFNAMISGIKEGFSNLAGENALFQNQVNSLKASLLTLKNALAGAFAPIAQAAIPYIQQLISWITSAVEAVGQFIAALTGRKTYIKAVQQTAGAFEDAAGAANDAKEAAEGYLSPLDEINKYDDGKDKGASSGGGGGGAGGAGQMFEEVPIESQFEDFAKRIKEMWKKADFTELGAILGQKLKDVLDSIDWEPIKETAAKIGKSIGTLINGFVEVKGLGESIGKTIGEGINTGITGINAFLDNTHWDSVGKFIGDGLNGVVNTVDWKGLGHLFAQKWNAIFETIGNAAKTFKWTDFGKNLATSLNTFIKDFKWEKNGANLGELAKGVLDAIISFLEKTNWQELGRNVANFIGAIDWTGIAERIAEGIGAAIGGLGALIFGLVRDAWNSAADYFNSYIEESGGNIIVGLWKGIKDAIGNAASWIKEHIFKPFIDGFKNAFGIHSPSTVMAEQGGYIIKGLLDGIVSGLENIGTWVKEHILKPILNGLKEKGSATLEFGAKIITSASDLVKKFVGYAISFGAKIATKVSDLIGKFVGYAISFAAKIGTKASDLIRKFVGYAISFGAKISTSLSTLVAKFKNKTLSFAAKITTRLKDLIKNFTGKVISFKANITGFIGNAASKVKNWLGLSTGGIYKNGQWQPIQGYANGGSPRSARLFYANENGIPELVGRIGSNTAVMNNGQIVASVAAGVYQAVVSAFGALQTYFASMTFALNEIPNALKNISYPSIPNAAISSLNTANIPGYATGQVIPTAMKRHLAWLGDNNNETEVVSSLSTIKQAQKEALLETLSGLGLTGNNGNANSQPIVVNLIADGKKLTEIVIKNGKVLQMSNGNNPFLLGNT